MRNNYGKGLFVFWLTGLSILFLIATGEGANICVSSPEELQPALTTAANNDEDDIIWIAQGTYEGNFTYNSSKQFGITIEGGYTAGCSTRDVNPANTVLDAGGNGAVLHLHNANAVNLKVDAITLQNGGASGLVVSASEASFALTNSTVQNNRSGGNGGGANIVAKNIELKNNSILLNTAAYGGGVNIEYISAQTINLYDNFISQNITNSGEGGGVHIKWGSPTVNFVNNVISRNATTIYIGGGHGGGAHISTFGPINFINNTVVRNTANPACCWGGGITIYYASHANVYNNIFWENNGKTGRDIGFYSISDTNLVLLNNDIDQSEGGVSGLAIDFDESNFNNVDPLFSDITSEDYHLQPISQCKDAGCNEAPQLPQIDKDGFTRIVDGTVDMGAYEYQGIIEPTAPDLFGRLKEFHYYKFDEKIILEVQVSNRGLDSEEFRVAFYLSDNGVTLGQLIDETIINAGLKTDHTRTATCKYNSETALSGKYLVGVIDSADQVPEMVETNNRVRVRIP